jgi:Beta-galactosidase/beta-glucuronidase
LETYKFDINVGNKHVLWSEFDPALYKVNFAIESQNIKDSYTIDFGLRDFSAKGTQFEINSLKTFLRGKHDACVFPLTGYPPMNKEEWKRQMRIAKEYGINHYRFHSWTPPQAAFDAANEEGIYMQAELPYWGAMDTTNTDLNKFLINEGEHILTTYGNNPSFVMMALGNELGGDVELMRSIVTNSALPTNVISMLLVQIICWVLPDNNKVKISLSLSCWRTGRFRRLLNSYTCDILFADAKRRRVYERYIPFYRHHFLESCRKLYCTDYKPRKRSISSISGL